MAVSRRVPSDTEIANQVNRILAGTLSVSISKRMAYLKHEIASLPSELQMPVENLVLLGKTLATPEAASPTRLLVVGGIFLLTGIIGVAGTVTLSLLKGMFTFLFALGAGFVGAAIPGTLKVRATKWHGLRVDATSGAAFFVLALYLLWSKL